jgi:acyl carrier protein
MANTENRLIGAPEVLQEIKRILIQDMQLNVTPEEIPDNYSLLDGGLALDSILIGELIARVEDQFALQFEERVLSADLLQNLTLLAQFVVDEHQAANVDAREREAIG